MAKQPEEAWRSSKRRYGLRRYLQPQCNKRVYSLDSALAKKPSVRTGSRKYRRVQARSDEGSEAEGVKTEEEEGGDVR
jgi:hypothetical protein